MRLSRTAGVVSAFALTTMLALTGATAASARPAAATGYVALGDSYSAGVGSGSYDSASGSCKRSTKAYPQLWANAHAPSSFAFTACSGARTTDVIADQLGPLSASTGLVTVSIGGNDAGFADTMETCALSSESACLSALATADTYIDGTLGGQLDKVYDAIRAKAPSAHVVVLGYPHLYKLDGTCIAGLSEKERSTVNATADELDSVTAKRAAAHGFTFADVRTAFTGHELCSGSAWLHSVTVPVDESYHPTATGQSSGYLPVLDSVA